jgi:hypothetical protein
MNLRRFLLSTAALTLFFLPLAHAKDDWQPITPEDLALKDNPAQPGAKAMILYRLVERDDLMGSQKEYVRIKIFTEEGKEYGSVEIPPFDRAFQIGGVQGRTIHPDGSIVPFSGQVFEKLVERTRNNRVLTKSFSMPDVTPGSIIEYRYTRYWEAVNPATRMYYYFPRSEWEIQGPLYQRAAHFVFTPAKQDMFSYRMQGVGLPAYAKLERDPLNKTISLSLHDLLPFEREPYMPPPIDIESRVLFFYTTDLRIPEGDEYWKQYGKKWYGGTESFMDKKGVAAKAVASITSSSDSPEAKLRKIYDYVQGFENLTFEQRKSEKETKTLNIRENKSVEDVLNNKYGFRSELNRTFVALARAAGVDATLVKITERDENGQMLHREWPVFSQLGYEIASTKVNGKAVYLDPGSPFCPFGILPWEDTGVLGLLLDKNMPTWVTVPVLDPQDALIKRTANLTLADDGSLAGEIVVTYTGEDAYRHRLHVRNEDETERKKLMEEVLQSWIPIKGDIELVEVNDWKSSNLPLVAKYKVSLPGFASQAGHRVLIPSTLFAGAYRNPFIPTRRVNPIVMENLYDRSDDVTIALPKSFQIESLPKAVSEKNAIADLNASCANENGALHCTREFQLKALAIDQKYYTAVRQYFQSVQAGTNEQAVLKMAN